MIRTRFAPSPTGYLHIGNLRTTLFEYLFAKKNKGAFIIRVEDTDQERLVPGTMENMLKTLAWVGIKPDEGVMLDSRGKVTQKGKFGPYIQSERLEIYKKYAQELIDNGSAYYAFDTAEELAAMRERQQARKLPTKYDRARMRNQFTLPPDETRGLLASPAARVARLKVPDRGEISFNDIVHGKTVFDCKEIDDQVLLKSDGYPTYHLAVVVDDHLMGITHVIRGDDWIPSTPKHLLLYKSFGWNPPEHAHVPLVVGTDKLKLSKRKGDVSTESYRTMGYLPEALINFIAFLGWNPGTEKEMYAMDELIRDFSLEKVSKAGAVFNVEKLDWYNKEYLKKLSSKELTERALPWFEETEWFKGLKVSNKQLAGAVGLERERITVLSELPSAVKFVFEPDDYETKLLVWRKGTMEEVNKILPELKIFLETDADFGKKNGWTAAAMEKKIGEWIAEKGYSVGSVLWPLRVALSGQQNSPGPYEIAAALGKEKTLRRLEAAVEKLTG